MPNIVEIIVRAVDKTKAGLTSPVKNLQDLQKSASNLVPAFGTIATAAEAAFVAMSAHAINVADQIGKMSQKAGIGTEKFSGFAYGMELAGGDAEALSKSTQKLNKFIADAAGGAEHNRDVMRQLGIAWTDAAGRVVNADTVMEQTADIFQKSADGAGKAAAAQELFGKSGADMIPFLNQGREGIRAAADEARAFGLVVGQQTAADAETFNDNLTRIKKAAFGVASVFVEDVIPILADLTTEFVEWIKVSGFVEGAGKTIAQVFKGMVIAVYAVKLIFELLGAELGAVGALIYEGVVNRVKGAIQIFGIWFTTIKAIGTALLNLGDVAGSAGAAVMKLLKGDFEGAFDDATKASDGFKKNMGEIGGTVGKAVVDSAGVVVDVIKKDFSNAQAIGKGAMESMIGDIKTFMDKAGEIGEGKKTITAPDVSHTKPQLKLIDTEALRKAAQDAIKIHNEMVSAMLNGSAKLSADENKRYQARLDSIANLKVSEAEKRQLEIEAEAEHFKILQDQYAEHLAIKADLDQAAKTGDVARSLEALQSIQGQEMLDLQARQEAIQNFTTIAKAAHFNMFKAISEIANTVYNSISNHITNAIMGTESWGAAVKNIGLELVQTIIRMAVQWIASNLIMKAAGAAMLAASVATGTAAAAELAVSWAVPATLSLIATVGGSAASSLLLAPAVVANQVFSLGASLTGIAHSGLDYVPREGTYLLDEGEAVLNKEENAARMQNQGGGGSKPERPFEIVMMLDGDVLGRKLVRMAQDGRLSLKIA